MSSQWAAVVGVACNAVNVASVCEAMMTTVLPPELCTVTAPVELLMIWYCAPAGTDVVGRVTVWARLPVNN